MSNYIDAAVGDSNRWAEISKDYFCSPLAIPATEDTQVRAWEALQVVEQGPSQLGPAWALGTGSRGAQGLLKF